MSIEYREGTAIDLAQLERLRASVGWENVGQKILSEQIHGSRWVISAWNDQHMIGFARAVSDGVTNGYICGVIVDAEFRGHGIGRELIHRIVNKCDSIRWLLHARPEVAAFYAKLGFEQAANMMRRERKS